MRNYFLNRIKHWQSIALLAVILCFVSWAQSASAEGANTTSDAENNRSQGHTVDTRGAYHLQIGDIISIDDPDGERSLMAQILPDGTIAVPCCGVMRAVGLSPNDLTDNINALAEKHYSHTQFNVEVRKKAAPKVYVLGQVVHPGLYPFIDKPANSTESSHSAESATTPSEDQDNQTATLGQSIALAGGLKDSADIEDIRVTRKAPKETHVLNLKKDPDTSNNFILEPNDVVFVPDKNLPKTEALKGPVVRVVGAVKNPGFVKLESNDSLVSIIEKCGGFTDYAATNKVYRARTKADGHIETEVIDVRRLSDLTYCKTMTLLSGDLYVVKRRTGSQSMPQHNSKPVGDFEPENSIIKGHE